MNEHPRVCGIIAGGLMSQKDEIIEIFKELKLEETRVVLQKCSETHENQRECPIFLMAALNGHHEMIQFLLDNYRDAIDLEQTGTVEFHMFLIEGATALWCAAGSGCLKTVMTLVEAGANVNHLTIGCSTPLRAACFEGNFSIVKYLIEKGADVNLCNNFHNSCLMISAFRGHLEIVRYLIDRGASINSQSCCGATALHFTADTGNLAMIKLLVEYGKGDLGIKNNCGMTPLMIAAERCQDAIVDYLLERTLDRQTRIDALELIGASFANDEERYDPIKAYSYLERAMRARWDPRDSLIKKTPLNPIAAYNYHHETETIQELETLKASLQDLYMEGLTIRERILGQQNPELTHGIIYRGAAFADEGNFEASAKLWFYSISLKHASKTSSSKEILRFCQLFCQKLSLGQKVEFSHLNGVLLAAAAEFDLLKDRYKEPMSPDDRAIFLEESDSNIHNFLYLVSIFARTMKNFMEEEVVSAFQCIHKESSLHPLIFDIQRTFIDRVVVTVEPRTVKKQKTILHLAVDCTTRLDDFHIIEVIRFPCPLTTRVLIDTHANVGATDSEGNTPLHIIAGCNNWIKDFISLHSIINQLTEAGAHVDAVNEMNMTPLDIAGASVLAMIFKINQKISLKCRAAQTIIRHRIPYIGMVPDTLKSFIELHGIPNTKNARVSSYSSETGTPESPSPSSN